MIHPAVFVFPHPRVYIVLIKFVYLCSYRYNVNHMELFAVSQWDIIMRLTIAVILGLLVGSERSRVGKRAGMRTYALVALGAALFTVISGMVAFEYAASFVFDPLRVVSQVVVGIGFLGAGVIFVQRQVLTGLTTAAGLWVVAGIGVACGFAFYIIAAYVTFLTLMLFELMWYVEKRFIRIAKIDDMDDEFPEIAKKRKTHHDEEG